MAIATQALLRDAMRRLNMTRDAFAERIGCRRRTLDSWLLPDESSEYRAMPEVARRYVTGKSLGERLPGQRAKVVRAEPVYVSQSLAVS